MCYVFTAAGTMLALQLVGACSKVSFQHSSPDQHSGYTFIILNALKTNYH